MQWRIDETRQLTTDNSFIYFMDDPVGAQRDLGNSSGVT